MNAQPAESVVDRDSSNRRPSLPQERLWLVDQLVGASSVYNLPVALRLVGRIDVAALEQSLAVVLARHDALRACFHNVNGAPVQRIVPDVHLSLRVVSVESLPQEERRSAARRLAADDAWQPFDLTTAPLVRALLVRVAPDDHLFVLTFHHIIFDGWSIGPLFREIGIVYGAAVEGAPAALEPPTLQYTDFAEWQREQDSAETVAYWSAVMAGAATPGGLSERAERAGVPVPPGGVRSPVLAPSSVEAVARFCGTRHVTPFMVHFTAFNAWLSRRTNATEIITAVPMAGRTAPGTEALIGFFVNSLPIRVHVGAADSFATLLSRTRGVVLDAYAHQHVSAQVLLDTLPARPAGKRFLVPVAFSYEIDATPPALPGMSASNVFLEPVTAKNEFTLTLNEAPDRVIARALYAADAFDASEVDAMVAEYIAVLDAAVANPDATVEALCAAAGVRPRAGVAAARNESRPEQAASHDTPTGIEARTNLTTAQTAMWMTQAMHPDVPLAYVPLATRIKGPIDVDAFVRAFRALVASTDSLRMIIREEDGVPIQVLNPDCEAVLEMVDMAGATEDDIERWVRDRSSRMPDPHARHFDAAFLTFGPDDHLWFLNQHHVFVDGWSNSLIRDRISRFYLRESGTGESVPDTFPGLLERVADVRGYQASPAGRADRDYLTSLLNHEIQPLRFFGTPIEKVTTAVDRSRIRFGPERTAALHARAGEAFGRRGDAANFHLIAAVLFAHLHRLTGHRSLSIGAPYHNRRSGTDKRAGALLKQTSGLFMDVLPIVVQVARGDSFKQVVDRVREAWSAASQHAAGGTPPEVRARACDVGLNYLPAVPEQLFGGLDTYVEWVHPGHETESLSIQVRDLPHIADMELLFDFHTDVFPAEMRPRMIDRFMQLLDACLDDVSRPIDTVDLLSAGERELVMNAWNRTEVPGTTDYLTAERFEVGAKRCPSAIAVEADGEAVTYGDLNTRADRVAAALARRGAGRETLVGVCAARSVAQLAALLGVMKARAAYLPLDPALPQERVEQVLEDSGVTLVLADERSRRRAAFESVEVIAIEDAIADREPADTRPATQASDLAYVIYTSGSTGVPKGVEICHASLANFVAFIQSYAAITPDDRVLQFASLAFDTAAEEIFPALLSGATLVLRTDEMLDSVDQFLDGCADRRITVLDLPTAYWHTVIDVAATRRPFPPSVRTVILGGEAVRPDMLAKWHQWVGSHVRLLNGYGPTETTVCATYADLTCATEPGAGPVSIGRPVWNAQAYVLDGAGQPVGPGIAGELHVGGYGLARGYRHDLALTAARFIAHPWRPGERLYATGDRARWREDGELEFVGRADQQVKVRGFRVEPAEIEARLQSHPAVREAVVMAQAFDGEARLIAYVATGDATPATAELRDFLEMRLPAYMVPAVFVRLEKLPRAVSGKVDRAALPAPLGTIDEGHVAPRNATEAAIAAVWSELLHAPDVGVHDNFFDLGGHSLLGTRVVARVADAVGAPVPLWLLFEHPTVAGLAAAIGNRTAETRDRRPVAPMAEGRRGAKQVTRVRSVRP